MTLLRMYMSLWRYCQTLTKSQVINSYLNSRRISARQVAALREIIIFMLMQKGTLVILFFQ
jgi:hypothetical protein